MQIVSRTIFSRSFRTQLRTPLNAIVGWAQVLQLQSLEPREAKEGLEAIERNARAGPQMIADLLDVSRIASGKLRLDAEPVDAAAVVEAALEAILHSATAKQIRIERSIDRGAGSISGDPVHCSKSFGT